VALAGVMGGEETGVTESTTRLWLESAYFLPSSIRRTSRELGLLSDSSYRFERDVDPAGVVVASQEATQLLIDLAGGQPGELRLGFAAKSQFGFDAEGAVEGIEYTNLVQFRHERCCDVLGAEVTAEDVSRILTRFGLKETEEGWHIPSFRPDLTREIDLIEEVARVVGIDALPTDNVARFLPSSPVDAAYDRAMALRRSLAAQGLHETRTLTLISSKALQHHFSGEDPVRLKNPLGEDHAFLRPALVPGLLDALARNARHGAASIRLFEIGRVFHSPAASESEHAALVLSGPLAGATWRTRESAANDLADLIGILSEALGAEVRLAPEQKSELALHARVMLGETTIGAAGQLWPKDARAIDATAPVVFAEIDLHAALKPATEARRYREIPRFPAITRDIAMVAPHAVSHAQIASALHSANEALLADARLFDLFSDPTGEKIPADKKSLAYSLTYRSPERTLTADEVNAAHTRLKERLVRELGVQLRE
jgi:phenylalanyl-tRNA synthetase beta chain